MRYDDAEFDEGETSPGNQFKGFNSARANTAVPVTAPAPAADTAQTLLSVPMSKPRHRIQHSLFTIKYCMNQVQSKSKEANILDNVICCN